MHKSGAKERKKEAYKGCKDNRRQLPFCRPTCLQATTLENRLSAAYSPVMDSIADKTPPADWIEALDQSLDDIAAGRIVHMEPALARGRAAIARLETRQQAQDKRTARKA